MDMGRACGAPEDMAQEAYKPQWGREGRDDLGIMNRMGANAIRLYHPIGELVPQPESSGFLDASEAAGLKVFGAVHQYLSCEDDDCYDSWFKAVRDGLASGFAKDGAWHPAVWAMNLINEVDAMVPTSEAGVKRIISAADGLLAAEKAAHITGSVNLTSCFTTALAQGLGGGPESPWTIYHGFVSMEAWMKDPSLVEYTPRSGSVADLVRAIDQRWIHCVNAQIPWEYGIKGMLADSYAPFLPRPWFIGEMGFNGAHGSDIEAELEAMNTYATEGKGFLGSFFFQFQTAYFKGQGSELNFGMFGLGATQVGTTGELRGKAYPVHCLTSREWAFEQPNSGCKDECDHRAQAVAKAFGGQISGGGVCLEAPPMGLGAKRRRLRQNKSGARDFFA